MKQVSVGWYREPKSKDEYWDPDTYIRRPSRQDKLGLWHIRNRRKRPRIKGKAVNRPLVDTGNPATSKARYLWGNWRYDTLDEAKQAVIATLNSNSPVRYGELSGWQYGQIGNETIVWR
jgi:hypothetical protein